MISWDKVKWILVMTFLGGDHYVGFIGVESEKRCWEVSKNVSNGLKYTDRIDECITIEEFKKRYPNRLPDNDIKALPIR